MYTTSLQDTIYAGAISGSGGNAARQYWFRGKITGDVDYMFARCGCGVFDHTTIYTTLSRHHGHRYGDHRGAEQGCAQTGVAQATTSAAM